jgi:hypothetical protein
VFRAVKNVAEDPEKINWGNSELKARKQLDMLAARLRDPRFNFMFRPGPWCPTASGHVQSDLDELLKGWLGGSHPIAVLDLSGIPPSILQDLVGAVLRIIYGALFWARNRSEGGRERPLLLVLEEAHTYVGTGRDGAAAEAVGRIAKEGRKYGVGLMLVSQRPSEIHGTILSQCGTIVAMRLANDTDRGHVTSAASDNLKGLFDMLPVLRTGEAIIVGEAVSLPVRTLIERLPEDRRPDSEDPRVVERHIPDAAGVGTSPRVPQGPGGWNRDREPSDYAGVLEQMRRQSPHIERHDRQQVHEEMQPAEGERNGLA